MGGLHWLDWFSAAYPVIVTIASLAASAGVLWLGTRFTLKADFKGLEDDHEEACAKIADHEERMAVLESKIDSSPTRQELSDQIGKLGARMAGVETGIIGMQSQLKTANDYLHTLIDKAIPTKGGR